jgi:DNA-binding response OmpR family regulator
MKILIIEDNEKLAKSIKKGLEQEGFAADYLLDGESGESRLLVSHADYDVVILDLMLPKKDGIAVCQKIREENITIPVLMLTAKDTVENKVLGLDTGADDYLIKPFAFKELIARIRVLLRRPQEILPKELQIDDLVLNTSTRTASRGDKNISLTLKEFMVLEYMMRNPNQIITRDQLYDHAWDFANNAFSNTVDVHIKNLRKKVDNGHSEKLLETIRGVGYRIKR